MDLNELRQLILAVEEGSLEFHMGRRDFEDWIREAIGDEELAGRVGDLGKEALSDGQLREKLHALVSQRCVELARIASEGRV
jgi:hypothetical protein